MGRRGQRRGKGKGRSPSAQQAPSTSTTTRVVTTERQKKRGEERRSRIVTHGVEVRWKTEGFAEDRQTRDTPTTNTKNAPRKREAEQKRVGLRWTLLEVIRDLDNEPASVCFAEEMKMIENVRLAPLFFTFL